MKALFFGIGVDGRKYIEASGGLKEAGIEVMCRDYVLNEGYLREPGDGDAEIIGVYVDSALKPNVLEKFPNLKIIATFSTGFDHIDLAYCKSKNITVSYVPAYGEHTVAEYAFALILALTKKICYGSACVREPGIRRAEKIQGCDLKGKTLGLVGTGKIGKNVAKIAKGFEMKVVAYDTIQDLEFAQKTDFKYVTLEELLSTSDIVTLHVPYLAATHHLMNEKTIKLMKKTAYLINTSRGGVVDTEALFDALENNVIAGAGLDVLEEETMSFGGGASVTKDDPAVNEEDKLRRVLMNKKIIECPNVIVTPHNASNTCEAHERIFETSIFSILSFFKGAPTNVVPELKK